MEKIVITKEKLMQMPDYVPLLEKMQLVKEAADLCFDRVELKIDSGLDSMPMPPLYKENTAIKSRVLMAAYAKLYLGEAFESEKNPWIMSTPDFDRFAASHIMNQIERLKRYDGEVRDKAFDVVADMRDLEKRLNTEIYGLTQVMNEPVTRIIMALQQQTTPEAVSGALNELKDAQKAFADYMESRKKQPEGA
jgi:hypothetical protein